MNIFILFCFLFFGFFFGFSGKEETTFDLGIRLGFHVRREYKALYIHDSHIKILVDRDLGRSGGPIIHNLFFC
jgi:hypothetical protein